MRTLTLREKRLLVLLGAIFGLVVAYVGGIQLFGAELGGPCVDSYSCRGFIVGGDRKSVV
jgi:hypothetical protein